MGGDETQRHAGPTFLHLTWKQHSPPGFSLLHRQETEAERIESSVQGTMVSGGVGMQVCQIPRSNSPTTCYTAVTHQQPLRAFTALNWDHILRR